MELTGIAEQGPREHLAFASRPGMYGTQAVSADGERTYHIANEGCGIGDRYSLRVNSTWLPYRGTVAEMLALADAVEAQNDETGDES
jgi:hypothetical protein